ncbi:MAG: OsmC family protein, partial [Gemmatimonadota bacterium]
PLGAPRLEVELTWRGGERFEITGRSGPAAAAGGPLIDGEGAAGPSPMETLLAALGSCGGVDVVEILRKGRQDVRGLRIRLVGERSTEVPPRFTAIRVHAFMRGDVEPSRAERAVTLAFEKYCSVRSSLDPAMPVIMAVTLEP